MTAQRTDHAETLVGLKVLLVEDNYLNAVALQTSIEEFGCRVVGPFSSIEEGLESIEHEPVDLAVLDVNILGGSSVPIAEALQRLGRPFVFVTGYGSPRNLPSSLRGIPRLHKPVDERALLGALQDAAARRPD